MLKHAVKKDEPLFWDNDMPASRMVGVETSRWRCQDEEVVKALERKGEGTRMAAT